MSTVTPTIPLRHKIFNRLGTTQRSDTFRNRLPNTSRPPSLHVDDFVAMETRNARQPPRYKLPIQPIQVIISSYEIHTHFEIKICIFYYQYQDLNIRLHERQMAYERTYSLLNPYKPQLSTILLVLTIFF